MAERNWFDEQLDVELDKLFKGESSLSEFKCFLMPNAGFLDLPSGHKAITIKAILAEQHTYTADHTDEQVISWLKEEFAPKR